VRGGGQGGIASGTPSMISPYFKNKRGGLGTGGRFDFNDEIENTSISVNGIPDNFIPLQGGGLHQPHAMANHLPTFNNQ